MLKSIFSQLPTTASVAARQRPSSNTSHSPLDHRHHNLTDIPTHPPLALPRTGRFPNHDIQLDRPLAAHEVDLAFNSEAQLSVNERINAIATLKIADAIRAIGLSAHTSAASPGGQIHCISGGKERVVTPGKEQQAAGDGGGGGLPGW